MKKLLTILSVLSALVSCAPQGLEVLPNEASGRLITLKASFEEPSTKTTLVDGTKVYWLPGDEIGVFTKNASARFTAGIQKASATSEFTGTLPAADKYYAFYPYSTTVTYDGSVIKAQIPSTQQATKDNVSNGLLLSAGVSSSDGSILFRNLVSGICFTLESEGVKFVELLGNKGEAIAGDIRVTVDESAVKTEIIPGAGQAGIRLSAPEGQYLQPGVPYYIICAPTVFSEGLTLTMVKDNDLSASCKIGGPVELKRSSFGRINQADKGLVFRGGGFPEGALPPDNEIWYTTSDNKPLASVLDQPGLNIQSHTFSNGMGVVRFSGPLTSFYQLAGYNDGADRLTGILIPDCVEYLGSSLLWDSNQIREFRIPARLAAASPGCFIRNRFRTRSGIRSSAADRQRQRSGSQIQSVILSRQRHRIADSETAELGIGTMDRDRLVESRRALGQCVCAFLLTGRNGDKEVRRPLDHRKTVQPGLSGFRQSGKIEVDDASIKGRDHRSFL